jgi:gliding motility-associated-like protein
LNKLQPKRFEKYYTALCLGKTVRFINLILLMLSDLIAVNLKRKLFKEFLYSLKRCSLFFFIVACSQFANCQQQASIWYFGDGAGLDFNTGVPAVLADGAMDTLEGCATISDATGNLLFYTDGSTVWGRNHVPMPNGTGLLGDASSSQSAIIVPAPNDQDTYYIFTATLQVGPEGINYSIVDMSGNGGLGDVTTKNVQLVNPATEKLTAVQHANGNDIWVITHDWGNDAFLSYLVTDAGVVVNPILSNTGFSLNYPNVGIDIAKAIGYVKVSPNGEKLAICHSELGAELFDFDAATGVVSNPVRLLDGNEKYYGVEFSTSSEVLYVSIESGAIYQYDAYAADVKTTETEILGTFNDTGALQLAIDGKIYVANYFRPYLSVVNNPNTLGLGCNFIYQSLPLGAGLSYLGLPPFIQSYFLVGIDAQNFCLGNGTEFSITSSEPILGIAWDFGDGNTSIIESPTHNYSATGTYTVSVTVTTATDVATEVKDIVITNTPVANVVNNIEICSTITNEVFDLSQIDSAVLGNQIAMDVTISYYATLADAQLGANVLAIPYTNTNAEETLFARISSVENPSCFDTTSFDILVKQTPIPSAITNVNVCDDDGDGLFTFDLATMRTNIQANETPIFSEVSFHSSQATADTNTNPLPDNYTNTLAVETIFFRIQNSTYPECYDTGAIGLEVIGQVIANTPTNLEFCDDNNDGQASFDLTVVEPEIIGTQDSNNLIITYHESQTDADAYQNAINASDYLTSTYQTTIYVRVSNSSDITCYDTTSFQLNIYDTPVAPPVTDWLVCDDDNDGSFLFGLNEKTAELIGAATNLNVSYYESQTAADTGQNALALSFENVTNPQKLFARVANSANEACYFTTSFSLEVFINPIANTPAPIVVCDADQTGRAVFDLSVKDAEVLNGQGILDYEVSYYTSELDALTATNTLNKTNYTNSDLEEIIYVRIQQRSLDFCYDTTSFSLIINPLPQLALQETYVICPDSPDLVIDGGIFETYEWQNEANEVVGSGQQLAISELGMYTLAITETTNGMVCKNTATFEVFSSGAPESFTVDTSGFSDTVILTVDAMGIGEFEYSLDGYSYQTSTIFEVLPGTYTIYVRDPLECRLLSQEITAIGYQKFFTPNGDGIHEYWNIIGAEAFPQSVVTIYDRYGKLVNQMNVIGKGWDGTYNGRPLPSSDYWFRYEYDNGKLFQGHFTLKR